MQSWSFLCLARKQLHLYCIVFPVLLWVPASQVSSKGRRTFREVQGRAISTPLLWLPSTEDFCFFFNISCLCCVYPNPAKTLYATVNWKTNRFLLLKNYFFIFQSVSAILISNEFFHQIYLIDVNIFIMYFSTSEITLPQYFFHEFRTWYKMQKVLENKMCIGLHSLLISTFNSSEVSFSVYILCVYTYRGFFKVVFFRRDLILKN